MPTDVLFAQSARPGDVSVPLASNAELRWSPVRFDRDRVVADQDLRALLEAARWAPSAFGEEPWRFIVAGRDDPWRPYVDAALMEGNAWARDAGALVVGLARRTLSRNDAENPTAAHDLGIALGNILAEATARGLATHAMGGVRGKEILRDFDVPSGFDVLWVLAVGHYDPSRTEAALVARDERPRSRRPLEETAFGARFGTPVTLEVTSGY